MAKKIGVLLGGRSAEREVSLRTGDAIYQALTKKGYHAVKIDIVDDFILRIQEEKIELAFLALHGPYGEDGTIQGLLEMLDIPYTGSGVLASALCMDKIYTKKILRSEALPTPDFSILEKSEYQSLSPEKCISSVLEKLSLPLVVKAPTQGSTIGIYFVHTKEELLPAIEKAFQYGNHVLLEDMISGVELTASVLGNDTPMALPLIEIVSNTGVYDYQAKYTAGMSKHIIPPRISPQAQEKIKTLAIKTFKALGCQGAARIDFLFTKEEKPYILEVNTIPGMTEVSLYPDAAKAAGISFEDLIESIVQLALEKNNQC